MNTSNDRQILTFDHDEAFSLVKQDGRSALDFLQKVKELYIKNAEFPMIELNSTNDHFFLLYIVGDVHGDLITVKTIMRKFLWIRNEIKEKYSGKCEPKLLFLGDYIDRAPAGIKNGGFITLFYILTNKMKYPSDIFLLRGNHEAANIQPFNPYDLPFELFDIFGESLYEEVHHRLTEIFDELPLFLRTNTGLIASHASFPKERTIDLKRIKKEDRETILETLWGDPVESETDRGEIGKRAAFTQSDLKGFLRTNGSNVLVRGHDHRTMGFNMYEGALLTLHTTKKYKERGAGGVLIARILVNPSKPVTTATDLKLMELDDNRLKDKRLKDWKP